jgi:hypothetical protein
MKEESIQNQSSKMIQSIKKQLSDVLQRAETVEKRVQELQKKNDDYKRAYADAKTNLGKAQSDLEKLKNPGSTGTESEFKDKYEHLKVKYKVSQPTIQLQYTLVVFSAR